MSTTKRRRGFTLTELMIAVAILIVVIAATSKIFSTASTVAGVSEATTNVLQEGAAIERQIRHDINRLSEDGFFAIRSVAVRNDFNGPVLLNPALPFDAIIRADQLVFFTNGVEGTHTYRLDWGTNNAGQGSAARVYYGHAFQLPNGEPYDDGSSRAHDLSPSWDLTPWYNGAVAGNGPVDMVYTTIDTGNTSFATSGGGQIDGTQPEARKWLFVRQPVILVDDDNQAPGADGKTSYLDRQTTARSIFVNDPIIGAVPQPQVRDARVDGAATLLNEIRWIVTDFASNDWVEQQDMVLEAMYYPRAERIAPSSHRMDLPLTTHVISAACSSFRVEWTWADGVGEILDDDGNIVFDGVVLRTDAEQPWFGLCDADRGVYPYLTDTEAESILPSGGWWWFNNSDPTLQTIDPDKIDRIFPASWDDHCDADEPFREYLAVFGYNKNRPLDPLASLPWDPADPVAYTPLPTAIRITMTLHDPNTRLAQGREFQFIVNVPERR